MTPEEGLQGPRLGEDAGQVHGNDLGGFSVPDGSRWITDTAPPTVDLWNASAASWLRSAADSPGVRVNEDPSDVNEDTCPVFDRSAFLALASNRTPAAYQGSMVSTYPVAIGARPAASTMRAASSAASMTVWDTAGAVSGSTVSRSHM
ncbi:hypothetical protein EOM39_04810 [Candidatus Gracilibacteria bacterium]|nr:hypothetical protein [Candidatus Gracilibacteria bacterium]